MRRAWVYACVAALVPLLVGCSRKVSDTHHSTQPASRSRDNSSIKLGDVVRTVQQHHGRVKLELDFSGSAISEAALLETPGLDCATALNLTGVPLTDAGLVKLVTRMPELRRIDLSGTLVTDAGLEHLKQLPKLEEVGYHSGQISRAALLQLVQFLAGRGQPATAN